MVQLIVNIAINQCHTISKQKGSSKWFM